jgi:hypothetical protein
MASANYYREEARRCRVRAARDPDSGSKTRWLQLASEYELLADDLEVTRPSRPIIDQLMQLQASQQHQGTERRREPRRRAPEPDTA